jgi:hypothetical protein
LSGVCVKDESGNPFYFFSLKNKKIENGQPDTPFSAGNAQKKSALFIRADIKFNEGSRYFFVPFLFTKKLELTISLTII